jgi:hypothetical protein
LDGVRRDDSKQPSEIDSPAQHTKPHADADKWKFQQAIDTGVHLVILVHGINTRAQWLSTVKPALVEAGLWAESAGYGFYGALRFLIPIDWLRRQAIERVRIRINAATASHKPVMLSVIAHSFGSYIVARLIAQEFHIKWHRIIFCGSVVSDRFPFEQCVSRFTSPILNEIGTRDYWSALAQAVTWCYGSVGSHGFQGAGFEERWHRGLLIAIF